MKITPHLSRPHLPSDAANSSDWQTKLRLATAINDELRRQGLSQSDAGTLLRIPQPKVSALVNYHLDGFSVQRLFRLLNALGRDVVIQITENKPGSVGKTSVRAA